MTNLKRMLQKVRVPAGTLTYELVRGARREYYETIKEELYEYIEVPPSGHVGKACLLIEGGTYYVDNCKTENGWIVQYRRDSCFWEEAP